MNYLEYIDQCKSKDYDDLILQEHHIIPKSQGGSDLSENLIKWTIKDERQ
jgi:5-methylcytosine-specific restriction endonuclease McrA